MFQQTYIKIYLCFCTVLALLQGCVEIPSPEGNASLHIRIDAPVFLEEVKNVSSDPDSPQEWTSWERVVDGRYLYRVTAFILQGQRLVSCKDVSLSNEATEAQIDFEANFTHGTYTLMIVANYSSFEAEDGENGTKTYDGLNGFSDTVQEILEKGTIDNFTQTYADTFMNFMISSENGVCKRIPQPLTLVKEITLHPGTNVISGELVRTYSRIRIAVENNSDEELKVSSLDFGDIFTQQKAYLFENIGYLADKTAIDVSSTDALTPFSGTDSEPLVVAPKEIKVVFDAYILESNKTNSSDRYTYHMDLGYDSLNTYTLSSTTSIKWRNNITSGHYLIYSIGASRFLTAGSGKVTNATLGTLKQGMSISKEFVWTFDGTGLSANRYYIGTAEALDEGQTSYYMNNPTSSSVTLGANKSVDFNVADKSSYLSFQSSGSGNYRYLSSNGSNVTGQRFNNNNNALFELYPVDVPRSTLIEIPVSTINVETGQAAEIQEIRRNDFINAVVKVSYSKNMGHFSFEVSEWYEGGGNVEFN